MSMVAVAIGGSALIGGATAYFTSKSQSKAAGKAAKFAKQAGDQATSAQLEMFYKSIELDKPFREQQLDVGRMGLEARRGLRTSADELYKRAMDPKSDPIYKLQERQMERGLAKRGLQRSGVAIDELTGLGASEAMRRENLLGSRRNVLTTLAGGRAGQSATAPLASQVGANMASIYQTQGQGLQQAALARGQAQAGLYQGLGNVAQSATAMYGAKQGWWNLREGE